MIFEHVHLQVDKGTVCCLLGANGCGKSTLIDCVLGFHPLMKGDIWIDGKTLTEYKPKELAREIAYLPQTHQQSFPYTVREIVLMGRTPHLGTFSGPGSSEAQLTEQVLRQVGAFHLADRPYTQISGGEMQLVMLARALVQQTPIMVMDEPTANLDYRNELLFLETMARLVEEAGVCVLSATHSPNQAFYLQEKGVRVLVAAMYDGTISAVGTPDEALTEETIRKTYGIDAIITEYIDEYVGRKRQISPVRVIGGEGRGDE